MTDKNKGKDENTTKKADKESIQFGTEKKICFACGEKLEPNTKVCPYCGVKQK